MPLISQRTCAPAVSCVQNEPATTGARHGVVARHPHVPAAEVEDHLVGLRRRAG